MAALRSADRTTPPGVAPGDNRRGSGTKRLALRYGAMQQERLKLRLREPVLPPDIADNPRAIVEQAISNRRCVRAVYNRDTIDLAPHALYLKHGEPYVDGIVQRRNDAPPKELKLGAFKLTGLGALAPTIRRFEPSPLFKRDADRYGEELVVAV